MSNYLILSDSDVASWESENIDDTGGMEFPGLLEEAEYSMRLAMSAAQNNLHESEIIREELSTYVDDLSQRKDSEGGALLKVPSNFGAVLNSMTREDVLNKSDGDGNMPPWSQYLLLDGLNTEGNAEFGGRYSGAFSDTPDVKIRRGLAQIEMLDRQLKETVKLGRLQRRDTQVAETCSMPDETFVTGGGHRSARRSPRFPAGKGTPTLSARTSTERDDSMGVDGEEAGHLEEGRQWLLDLNGGEADREILEKHLGTYLAQDDADQLRRLDEELARFGRIERLRTDFVIPTSEDEQRDNGGGVQAGHSGKPDFLAEQRAARRAAAEADRLDELIRQCTAQPIDYEALVDPTFKADQSRQESRKGGASALCAGSLSEVPPLHLVQPAKRVTQWHIQQLLQELLSTPPAPEGEAVAEGEEAMAPDRAAIKALVQRYKAEVQALARARVRAATSPAPAPRLEARPARCHSPTPTAPGAGEHSDAPPAEREPEAEAQNWLLDWGEESQPAVTLVNAAHPAVVLSEGLRGKHSPRTLPVDPEHSQTKRVQTNGANMIERHYDSGWLPPLPPRSAEGQSKARPTSAGGQGASSRNAMQPRSPSKSLRLQTEELGAAAAGAGAFQAGGGRGYGRQRGTTTGVSSLHVQQSSREARASNVLNSMSAFLSREVLATATADRAGHASSQDTTGMRI